MNNEKKVWLRSNFAHCYNKSSFCKWTNSDIVAKSKKNPVFFPKFHSFEVLSFSWNLARLTRNALSIRTKNWLCFRNFIILVHIFYAAKKTHLKHLLVKIPPGICVCISSYCSNSRGFGIIPRGILKVKIITENLKIQKFEYAAF